jgi:hypothetical protein
MFIECESRATEASYIRLNTEITLA